MPDPTPYERIAGASHPDAGTAEGAGTAGDAPAGRPPPATASWLAGRAAWAAMAGLVAAELAVGLAVLVLVPVGRPSGLVPSRGIVVYDVHAAAGAILLAGAVALVAGSRRSTRIVRAAAVAGLLGIVLGGVGGLLATARPLRPAGVVLMFAGAMVAGLAYLAGLLEPSPGPPAVPPPVPPAGPPPGGGAPA